MMDKNIFLDILSGKIPAEIVYEDPDCVAFRDVNPVAPTHVLVIPRKEIRTHADVTEADAALMGRLHLAAQQVAKQQGLTSYRLVINCNEEAGQSVPHLHMHVIGGRRCEWPPG